MDKSIKSKQTERLRIVLLTVFLSLVTVLTVRDRSWSNGNTAATLGLVNTALLLSYAIYRQDWHFLRLITFGAIFGIVELVADALCVMFTGTLDYTTANSLMLWHSPWWMPIAWLVVAVQIGYIGSRLIEHLGKINGALLTAFLGAVNIPFYEEMARFAHWWEYRNCIMIPGTHTPVYIVIAELFIGLCLGVLTYLTLQTTSLKKTLLYGVIGGFSTVVGGLIGYGLIERVLPLFLRHP